LKQDFFKIARGDEKSCPTVEPLHIEDIPDQICRMNLRKIRVSGY